MEEKNNNNNNNNGAVVAEPKNNDDSGIKLPTTQEELDALLQAEGDKRVSQALKKVQAKNEAKIREAEKLAKMNADEQYQYQLEQREKAIEEREKQLALLENTNQASKILADKGLSLSLVDLVVADNADDMDAKIKLLDRAFKASVKAEIEKRLGHSAPIKEMKSPDTLTKEEFAKLSIMEKARLKQEDPELYNSLKTVL